MKNYTITVGETAEETEIQPSQFLDLTVGTTAVKVKFIKSPKRGNSAEEGDFCELVANGRYQLKVRKGAVWLLITKVDSGTSTLTVKAMGDQLIVVDEPAA